MGAPKTGFESPGLGIFNKEISVIGSCTYDLDTSGGSETLGTSEPEASRQDPEASRQVPEASRQEPEMSATSEPETSEQQPEQSRQEPERSEATAGTTTEATTEAEVSTGPGTSTAITFEVQIPISTITIWIIHVI